jgi:hypothetical protein
MDKGLFLEEQKDRLGYGKSQNKLKLWRPPSKNIAAEFGPFKSVKITLRL